ncbi:MAG: DUF4912 domain-containing protein [Verrucomicrobia bacterium]|nr:DUF4912 domain-containing protein [Verrucomicrobiota bacterium]
MKPNGKKSPAKKPIVTAKKSPPAKTSLAATLASKIFPAKKSSAKSDSPRKQPATPQLRLEPLPIDPSAHKFVLQPFSPGSNEPELPSFDQLGELPESYGTRRLFLAARDPRWLYAYWDFTWQQMRDAEQEAPNGQIFLQVFIPGQERVHQIHVFPGSREWYLPVHRPATPFQAELGYYRNDGSFNALAVSDEISTPRDDPSQNRELEFVTIPFHYSFRQLLDLVRGQMLPGESLAKTLARLQNQGYPLPFAYALRRVVPSGVADRILDYLGGDLVRRTLVGSLEITETLRRRLEELSSSGAPSSLSSAALGRDRTFAMHVNAELILYGGTVPGARVSVDGREINLRPDGTFSYHFTFPDGQFHIPIQATAPDGEEKRSALLSFLRLSTSTPGVDPTAQPPIPEPLGRSA